MQKSPGAHSLAVIVSLGRQIPEVACLPIVIRSEEDSGAQHLFGTKGRVLMQNPEMHLAMVLTVG